MSRPVLLLLLLPALALTGYQAPNPDAVEACRKLDKRTLEYIIATEGGEDAVTEILFRCAEATRAYYEHVLGLERGSLKDRILRRLGLRR